MFRFAKKILTELVAGVELNHLQTENRRYRSMYYTVEKVNHHQHELLLQARDAIIDTMKIKREIPLPESLIESLLTLNSYYKNYG